MQADRNRYADMLFLQRPISGRHARMERAARGAQFSPFSALTGLEDVLLESGRQTGAAPLLDPDEIARLDRRLRWLADHPETEAIFFCFVPDERKSGGAIVPYRGKIRKTNPIAQTIQLDTVLTLPVSAILQIADAAR